MPNFTKVLARQFNLSLVLLLPPVLVMAMAYFRFSAIPGIVAGAIAAALLGFWFQGYSYETLMTVFLFRLCQRFRHRGGR